MLNAPSAAKNLTFFSLRFMRLRSGTVGKVSSSRPANQRLPIKIPRRRTMSSGNPPIPTSTTQQSTAAPPHMSYFMSSMPAEGLILMPPESKVRPLPTRRMVSLWIDCLINSPQNSFCSDAGYKGVTQLIWGLQKRLGLRRAAFATCGRRGRAARPLG